MPQHNTIIVRYSEIGLKGDNRPFFESKLVKNIKGCLKRNNISFSSVRRIRGRIIVETDGKCDLLRNVFGIASFSYAVMVDADVNEIFHIAEGFLPLIEGKRFRVSVKRGDKRFKMNSVDLEKDLGEFVLDNVTAKVSLKDFEIELCVEIYEKKAYVSAGKVDCFGGLPLGSGGFAAALLEDKDSFAAAWLMMKRGVMVFPVAFGETDISPLERFSYGYDLKLRIVGSDEDIIDFVREKKLDAVIVNDGIQDARDDFEVLTLRPLAGFPKDKLKEIQKLLR